MVTSNKRSSIWSTIKKTIRFFLYFILAIIILVNLFILLSGRTYIYKGIVSTYFVGELGPTIYDLDKFPKRIVKKAKNSNAWQKHPFYNSQKLPVDFENYQLENETAAFLVFKDDKLLFEKYWGDHTSKTISNSFSVAKTVVSLLIGIAIDEGKIKSLDEPIGNYIPEFQQGEKAKITIRHLLLMSSGLDWTESGSNPLSNNAESYYGTNLYELTTRQNVVSKPGRKFIYQSGNSQLLGFIIKAATGLNVSEYCSQKIWSRIGVESDAYWSLDRQNGDEKAFCCLYATARDFGKIGALILHKGRYGKEQIVSEWYMNEMFQVPLNLITEEGIQNHQYGLHIWVFEGYSSKVYYCRGIKGQYIISIPDENLVIVRLGSHRKKNVEKPDHPKEVKRKIHLIGHPIDLPDYINFAEKIVLQTK